MKFLILVLVFYGTIFGSGKSRNPESNSNSSFPFIGIDIRSASVLTSKSIQTVDDQIKLVSQALLMNEGLRSKTANQMLDDMEKELGIYVPQTDQEAASNEERMDQEGKNKLSQLIQSQKTELDDLKKKKRGLLIDRLEITHSACVMALGSEKGSRECKENIQAPDSKNIHLLRQMNASPFTSMEFKRLFNQEWEIRKTCFKSALRECSQKRKGCCDKPLYTPRDLVVFAQPQRAG